MAAALNLNLKLKFAHCNHCQCAGLQASRSRLQACKQTCIMPMGRHADVHMARQAWLETVTDGQAVTRRRLPTGRIEPDSDTFWTSDTHLPCRQIQELQNLDGATVAILAGGERSRLLCISILSDLVKSWLAQP